MYGKSPEFNDPNAEKPCIYPIFLGYFHRGKGTVRVQLFRSELFGEKKRLKTKKIGLNHNDSSRYLAAGEGFEPSHTESEF